MKLSVEISMYPLNKDYIPPIKDFIDRVKANPALTVITNTMSTQVFGDYTEVMQTLQNEMQRSFEAHGKAVFVAKFIPGDLSPGLPGSTSLVQEK